MLIPKKFTLGGIEWHVEEVDRLVGAMGVCFNDTARIQIDKTMPLQVREQTFCHELVHAMFYAMGKTNHDEEFVDGLGTFIHQFLKTAK